MRTVVLLKKVILKPPPLKAAAMPCIPSKKTALAFGKTFPNNYKRDENVVRTLKPYMVTEIIAPTAIAHPVLSARVKEATEK